MEFYDGAIELPVDTRSFVKFICKILEVNDAGFIEKFEKLEQAQRFDSGETASTFRTDPIKTSQEGVREKKYEQFLKTHPTPADAHIMDAAVARKAMQELADACAPEKTALDELDEQRREFVREMYKKPKI